ncbi:early endosome antigen 1-like isoform X3 [Acanthaster planci]|uniref:Early endosome antigen 1-like isoform X3 n=1 Tax=Acanthaster planci TaxID=133434 RepID=A0A8B7Z1Q9_ACAPL|nr:early endosome antigen 1-like isoform X3 [Acanthaster planci]
MASIADTDSLSGIEPLDSTATSPLLSAPPISAHPDNLSPASQLSSLRTSLVQSSTLLKGSDEKPGKGLDLEDSPEFRLSNVSTLTQSSLEKHNLSHHYSDMDGKKETQVKGQSSLPSTPYSSKQQDWKQPQRLLATADYKHQSHSQTHPKSCPSQDMSTHQHQTASANRQLFNSQPAKTASTAKNKRAGSRKEPHPLNALLQSSEMYDKGQHDGSAHKPEDYSTVQAKSLNSSLLQSYHSSDVKQATLSMNYRQSSQRIDMSNTNSRDKTRQSHSHDLLPKPRITTSAEKSYPEIQEMEKVRRSLYHMVHSSVSRPTLDRDSLESKQSVGELLAANHSGAESDFPRESFESARTESLLGPHAYQDVSPLTMDSGLGLSSLRNLSNIHVPPPHVSSRDGTLFTENQMLKDSLEKERYRRKHCEKEIGDLQAQLLETQQQLAIEVSTNRKKDAMIEQLDKTLARIVDGWRKQEQEKDEALETLTNEKEEMLQEIDQLRKALDECQKELEQAKEKLSSELQQALQLQRDTVSQLVSLQEDHSKLKDQLVSERKLTAQAQHQRDNAIEECHRLEKQVKQVQHMLAEERQQSQSARKDFQARIEHFEKEHQQLLERQKAKIAEDKRNSELLSATQQELTKLKAEFDDAVKDRENIHLELNLQQAQAESAQQKLEAEWQEKLERLVDDRLRELQLQSSKTEAELREAHRKQLSELHNRHQNQLLSQRSTHTQDLAQRDKKTEDLSQQYKTRLEQHHQDMAQMTQRLKKAQQQRSVLVQRLQGVQVYCSDVLSQVASASPLIKQELRSGMETVRETSHTSDTERTQGARLQDSPITISVSPPRRGVGVGAGNLDDSKQEHEDGDGQEDDAFLLPHLSLATSVASQSFPSTNAFSFITDTSFRPNPIDAEPVGQSEYFNIPTVQDTTDKEFSCMDQGRLPNSDGQIRNDGDTSEVLNRIEQTTKGTLHGKPQQTQEFQSRSAPKPDSGSTSFLEPWRKTNGIQDPSAQILLNRPEYPSSIILGKQHPNQDLQVSSSRTDATPTKEPSQRKGLYFSSGELIPSQDLISDGLRLLEMSPPSGHSSPLRDPPGDQAGMTLEEILRATRRGWAGLGEGTRQDRQDDFKEFGEIEPSFDDTKTTNSVATYPSEDETVSELESGPIHPESTNIVSAKLAEHKQRQLALQQYIQMLLQQPPGTMPVEATSRGTALTKETVSITTQKQGMTTWQELAPQNHKQGSASTRNPQLLQPVTNRVAHSRGSTQPSQTQPDQRSKARGIGGCVTPRQAVDKPASTGKTKGPIAAQQPQSSKAGRHGPRTAPVSKPNRQVFAATTTGHKKIFRKGAPRN